MPFAATWMDLEIITLSEVRERTNITYHLYVESNKKNHTKELIYKIETGVPIVAQWKQIRLGTKKLQVQSLASLSGLGI